MLAVDTASRTEALALAHGDWAVSQLACRTRRGHAGLLLPQIDRQLAQQGWSTGELDGFGVVVGPGSFTGVRVGIATVAGLARATGKPAFAYGSLQARALALRGLADPVVPILDARKGEVYGAAYLGDRVLLAPRAAPPEEFATALAEAIPEGPMTAIGGGARLYADLFAHRLGGRLVTVGGRADFPGVAEMAVDVARRVAAGEVPQDAELAPVYLRPSSAELTLPPRA